MPTVREDIEPLAVFPATKGENPLQRVSVFPAEHWEKWGGRPGMYRIMVGEAWVCRKDERVSFFTRAGYKEYMGRRAEEAVGIDPEEPAFTPSTPKGTRVWVRTGVPVDEKTNRYEMASVPTFTRTVPFLDEYGEWRVWVGLREHPVLLADLRQRERGEGVELVEGMRLGRTGD